MNDSISRKAALDALKQYEIKRRYTLRENEIYWNDAIDRCVSEIEELPDVPEKNVGEWILLGCGWARCSQCGVKHLNVYDDDHWFNFCPHCGTKMEGVICDEKSD